MTLSLWIKGTLPYVSHSFAHAIHQSITYFKPQLFYNTNQTLMHKCNA